MKRREFITLLWRRGSVAACGARAAAGDASDFSAAGRQASRRLIITPEIKGPAHATGRDLSAVQGRLCHLASIDGSAGSAPTFYFPYKIGVALKAKRWSRFASKRSSVLEPTSLSRSMMSWTTPQ
jgi:hypothetical protein